jgi:ribosomal protein S20
LIGNERQGTSLIERGDMTRLAGTMICFGLAVGLSGCNKKPVAPALPPVLTPVALEDIPEPDNLPEIAFQPLRPPPSVVVARNVEPKRQRKKPAKVEAPAEPPVQVAAAAPPPPEETAIGALTAGGEASPQTKQDAEDLIASSEKRLNALSAQKAEEEKAQVSKVKNFLKDAQDALKSGDAEGAKTLATKAKLLLDDLEK